MSNNDLAELLDYYLLTQKKELPAKFKDMVVPEGREALVKMIQARLRSSQVVGQLREGWGKLKEQILPAFNYVPGKYATLEFNKLSKFMMFEDWELARQWLLECIRLLIDTEMSHSRLKWPTGLPDPAVVFADMSSQITVDVLRSVAETPNPVLVIGMPEYIDRNDKLVDVEAIMTLKRSQVELQEVYSGWTIQTVSQARFHE